jgi:Multidrug resistance efflux pump
VGITGCLILTVGLITVIFYNHPSTQNVTLFFRTVPIVPEINGRVAEVYIGASSPISKGAPIFSLDSSKQEAAAESARRKIAETDAEMLVARSDVLKTEGQIEEAKAAHQQTLDELETKRELQRRNAGNVAFRDIEKLEVTLQGRKGAIAAAPPQSSKPRSGLPPFCRRRRRVPKRRWRRPKWNCARLSFVPA